MLHTYLSMTILLISSLIAMAISIHWEIRRMVEKPFPHNNLKEQREAFEKAGFDILKAEEAFCPIRFFDIGAFVWFARIIEWEFPGFSVEKCYNRLLQLQRVIEKNSKIEGTAHRFLIVAQKTV